MKRPFFLLSVGLAVCAGACGRGGPAERVAIEADECYALAYDPDDADPTMFPTRLELRSGPDSGAVSATPRDTTYGFWQLFGSGAAWRRLPNDSVRVDFANEISVLSMMVAHDGKAIEGRSAFYFEKGKEPNPVLRVRGSRVDCGR